MIKHSTTMPAITIPAMPPITINRDDDYDDDDGDDDDRDDDDDSDEYRKISIKYAVNWIYLC